MSYKIPIKATRAEREIRKSRFIGDVAPVRTLAAARQHRLDLRREFSAANHHCWAYLIGDPASTTELKCDDDSEPAGTAGRPILNVLQHKLVGDVQLVVVRFFGGVKLGAGGLVRAYSSTASLVMSRLALTDHFQAYEAAVHIPFETEPRVRRVLDELEAEVLDTTYREEVIIRMRTRESRLSELKHRVAEATAGHARWDTETHQQGTG